MTASGRGTSFLGLCSKAWRVAPTPALSCSVAWRFFFKVEAVAIEEPPHRAAAAGDRLPPHRCHHLIQRQVRLARNQRQQPLRMLIQQRLATAARLCRHAPGLTPPLHPLDRRPRTYLEPLGRRPPRGAPFNPP